ncbi:M20 metallopeptidase family protein [Bailinhaonella thermotolerans]|uniref:Amidohydrolase n=1 Tax=Bailinhaonella thermotolerans TaxID=1070861 RepID=A0A3A4AT20_9ACTN|nr:M20 family metallopeptidase [Bailinhaonella thermotolerans]RJL33180.1 amidohydrolase [Bailinhaonella thermotolerans]
MSVLTDAQAMHDDLVRLRRDLHREPEVGLKLPRTQEKVLNALAGLPLEITTGTALSSVTGVLRGGRPGPTVLLRADMDGLPVTETTGVDYASQTGTTMHACGHDLHTAALVGAAHLLGARREEIAGNVVLMFQPGEEGYHGARYMIEEGVLDASGERAVAAYGIHVTSAVLPRGWWTTRRGPMMAAADVLRVTVKGAGGHASAPHRAKDPIPVACEMVTALQTLVTRKFDVFDPVVVTVGQFHAGTRDNVIPDDAAFEATIRSFSEWAHARVKDEVVRLVRGVAEAHGLGVEVDYADGYPVTVNHDAETDFTAKVIEETSENFLWAPYPITGAEDFSYVLNAVPGTFALLSACPPELDPGTAAYNHSPEAVFDDAVLPDAAAVLANLALSRLAAS